MSKQNIEFKDSGIPWIGEIPKHWEISKIKYVANLFTGNSISDSQKDNFTNSENSLPYIATKDIELDTNLVNYKNGMYIPKLNSSFKIAPKNSILLCIEGGSAGRKISFINKDVCFVNKLCCFVAKPDFLKKFLYYYCQNPSFISEFKLNLIGLIGGVSINSIKNFKIPLPPLNEQKEIAEFLDKKCEIIDKRLSNLERKIKSLKEYKKSLISECVTKGLNPKNMEFKDSGIPWIGQIPKHWKISKIKYHGTARNGLTYSPSDLTDENGILVLRASNIQNDKLSFNDNVYVSCPIKNEIFIKKGDILICATNGSKELVGKNVLIKENIKCAYGGFMMVLRSEISNFLQYILKSKVFEYHRPSFSTTTINQLTREKLLNLEFPLPPLNEQKEIAEFLDKKCEKIDRLNENYTKQITALKEYKKSLIYECVTGKNI
ncbi:restriction endonuclease subunit S [Campylobacter lanienae]|uniref:restriction endonuclease subunit S n=1 Tax=Campylobacter lanienae TaxID=75658 RepID=UPI00112F8C26|nr:restriction endonuclease subunit S [Campylobacter lanienae]